MNRTPFKALPGPVSFTVDVEEHRAGGGAPRWPGATRRILDLLDEIGMRGTFFVVGELAATEPGLMREIAARGHELGSHGQRHVALRRLTRTAFARDAADSRAALEDAAGVAVRGYRAPMFSLTPEVPWAAEELSAAGYAYSSSVLPAWSPMAGWPGAPRGPFAWPCGLVELPCPVARLGPVRLPFLGGMYLRYLPPWRLPGLVRRVEGAVLWSYCHPYDLDLEEGLGRTRHGGALGSLFLWMNRGAMARRLRAVMEGRGAPPLGERVSEARTVAVAFDPQANK